MLVMDTIADVVVGSAVEEDRAAGSHDSIEGDASGVEDDTCHVAFVHSEVEWPVWCSSCPEERRRLSAPKGQSQLLDKRDLRRCFEIQIRMRIYRLRLD